MLIYVEILEVALEMLSHGVIKAKEQSAILSFLS